MAQCAVYLSPVYVLQFNPMRLFDKNLAYKIPGQSRDLVWPFPSNGIQRRSPGYVHLLKKEYFRKGGGQLAISPAFRTL